MSQVFRKALPAPVFEAAAGRAAETPTETIIAELFADPHAVAVHLVLAADDRSRRLTGHHLAAADLMGPSAPREGGFTIPWRDIATTAVALSGCDRPPEEDTAARPPAPAWRAGPPPCG